jgi:hypothetical protein
VSLLEKVLLSRPAGLILLRDTWARLEVSLFAGALTVSVDEIPAIRALSLPGWGAAGTPPAGRTWQFRLGVNGEGVGARHVSHVRLRAAALAPVDPRPMGLVLSGQQHVQTPFTFEYQADPIVSAVRPQSGPVSSPTLVRITGANLEYGVAPLCALAGPPRLEGGSGESDGSADSGSAGSGSAGSGSAGSGLAGSGFADSGFADSGDAGSGDAGSGDEGSGSASSGSGSGDADASSGSLPTFGDHLGNGIFAGSLIAATDATYPTELELLCPIDALWEAGEMRIGLLSTAGNAKGIGLPFSKYDDPIFEIGSALDRHSGFPGSVLQVRGTNLAGGADRRCRFGGAAEVAASLRADGGALQCAVPQLVNGSDPYDTLIPLRITLNGGQYHPPTASAFRFIIFREGLRASAAPQLGPVGGGTIVSVVSERAAAMEMHCRFGVGALAAVVSATRVDEHRVVCASPPLAGGAPRGPTALAISNNGGADWFGVGSFAYYASPLEVVGVSPARRSQTHPVLMTLELPEALLSGAPNLSETHSFR